MTNSILLKLSFLLASALALLPCSGGAQEAKLEKILFLGNSITLHGPSAKVDWKGNWGMAASAEDKDYVHLVVGALTKSLGHAPQYKIANISEFERGYDQYDIEAKLKDELAFKPDVVVLAIGENVAPLKTDEAKSNFKQRLLDLLNAFKSVGTSKVYVRSCFWAEPIRDGVMKEDCMAVGGTFVDISTLSKDESNYARSERSFTNDGVARHPGDKGMQAIADAIVQAIQK
jgi:lysophospholipase L1-like esterase